MSEELVPGSQFKSLIEQDMQDCYLRYSMSVIVARALPDARDGFKPVHRRVMYSMHKLGVVPNKGTVKSARIVGDVIGKYHPHGDSAVYETLARMAQDFSLRYPLVFGQGNFGSIDGDSPAAMRYTEAKMNNLGALMLEDLEKDTVDMGPNYDESLEEPLVLPSALPNMIVNGTSGIAVGMATNMAPHNLREVGAAIHALAENPDLPDEKEIVIKGGSFRNAESGLNYYSRGDVYFVTPISKSDYVGFRLAFGAIPSASWSNGAGGDNSGGIKVLVGSSAVRKLTGKGYAKLAFRDDVSGNLSYVDFSYGNPLLVEIKDSIDSYHPEISPDGNKVAFSTGFEGVSGKSSVYVRNLDASGSGLVRLEVENAAIPRWRVLKNGDTAIVYVTYAGDNKAEAWSGASTWQVPFSKGAFGTPEKLFDGAFHGGVSLDGTLAVTGSKELKANKNGTVETWYGGEQACNVSLGMDSLKQTLFLDFAGSAGQSFVGHSYVTHEVALVADSMGQLVNYVEAPEGFTFDHAEWLKNSSGKFVATLTNSDGAHQKIVAVDVASSAIVELVSGDEIWHPCLWVKAAPSTAVNWDLDSLGFYGDAGPLYAQKMGLMWQYRDSVEVAGLGISRLWAGMIPERMTKFAINMAILGCHADCYEFMTNNYLYAHMPKLKYLVLSIDPDMWQYLNASTLIEQATQNSRGFNYDKNHGYWLDGIDDYFVDWMAQTAKMSVDLAIDTASRGWRWVDCVDDWASEGRGYVEILDDSTYSDITGGADYNVVHMEKVIESARDKGIKVIGVVFPQSPYYKNTGAYGRHGMRRSAGALLIEQIRSLQQKYDNFYLMDENKMGNHDYVNAGDYDHLCIDGAQKFTAKLDSLILSLD